MERLMVLSERVVNYHRANSIIGRRGTGDALTAAARRFIKTKSSVKFQAVNDHCDRRYDRARWNDKKIK
jgi:hypothetical protein